MTRIEYMQKLFNALAPLSQRNRDKIMSDYEKQFDEEIKNGKTEEQIIYDLGNPENAAKYFIDINKDDHGYNDNFLVESSVIKNNSNTAHSWEATIWSMLSIVIVPVLIVLMIILFAVGAGLFIAGIVCTVLCFLINSLSLGFLFLSVAGLFLAVLGIFIIILSVYDVSRIMKRYFSYIKRRIRYGGKRV